MINFLLKYPFFYRLYQNIIRSKTSEYRFLEYLFKELSNEKLKILDICCGDSNILNFIDKYIFDYVGIDYSDKYLNLCSKRWKQFKFLKCDLSSNFYPKEIIKFNPNFIFLNGAIHHLDNNTVKSITNFVLVNFPHAKFLSIAPIINNNKILNKIMLKMDRGKYIRDHDGYSNLMKSFKSFEADDFIKINFKTILFYRNFDLPEFYYKWLKITR